MDFETETLVCGTLSANGKAAGSATQQDAENGILVANTLRADGFDASEDGTGRGTPLVPIAFDCKQSGEASGLAVRRLLVEECEALQGFPRGYTLIPYHGKPAADGPRYRALGNSWAVPVARWIGERILAAARGGA